MVESARHTAALGVLVLVAGILFVWGLFFFMGAQPWRSGTDIVVMLENGGGLKRGDRVQLQGVEVGTVRSVQLEAPRTVSVDIRLNKGYTLPADTRATVRADVFGAHTVDLLPGQALVRLETGDTIRGYSETALPDLMTEVGGHARAVLARTDSLLGSQAVLDMQATASVLPESAVALREAFVELQLMAGSLRRSAEALETAEPGAAMTRALDELETSARAFTSAANSLEVTLGHLGSVLAKIDEGEGTLARMVNDSSLYYEVLGAFREMRELAVDVRERPGRYLNISVF